MNQDVIQTEVITLNEMCFSCVLRHVIITTRNKMIREKKTTKNDSFLSVVFICGWLTRKKELGIESNFKIKSHAFSPKGENRNVDKAI